MVQRGDQRLTRGFARQDLQDQAGHVGALGVIQHFGQNRHLGLSRDQPQLLADEQFGRSREGRFAEQGRQARRQLRPPGGVGRATAHSRFDGHQGCGALAGIVGFQLGERLLQRERGGFGGEGRLNESRC